MTDGLGIRDRSILWAIISSYISNGDPVGSRYLSKSLDFNLSSATIRNIMSDLEEMGYLKQPHISAGRIPTDKAYRFYVDSLVKSEVAGTSIASLKKAYRNINEEPKNLMRETSKALSDISHYIALVMSPRFINTTLKHIEFIKLRKNVLAILVSEEGYIQNKLIETDREYTQKELDEISAMLNTKYAHHPLRELRSKILAEMNEDKNLYDTLLAKAMELGSLSFSLEQQSGDVYVEGASNILSLPEFADLEKMKTLFQAFEKKNQLVEILGKCIDAVGIKIFIGSENPFPEMEGLSLVVAPYKKGEEVSGVIGVLGPTRMEYSRVISVVDYTAKFLSHILTGSS